MMKIKTLLASLAVVLFAACSTDENVPQVNDELTPATFTAGITQTRASGTSWDANDAIGIYMLNTGTTDIAEAAANRKYTTPAADGKFTPATADQTIYYPTDETQKVDFIAYYPHAPLAAGHIYQADVTTQTAPAAIDLMYSNNQQGKDKINPKVTLEFAHRLSRVEVNVEAGAGFTATHLKDLEITLSAQPLKADFEVLTGKLTLKEETGLLTLNTAADGQTASAIILPQDGLTGRTLTFTMKNNPGFTWNVEADRTFDAGKKTIFNIVLARTGIEVTTSIQPWGTQGVVDGDADIQ